MKWTRVTIETTTETVDMLSYLLGEYGVEGIEIEDKIPLSEQDKKAMYIDYLPELPKDDGVAVISCYVDEQMDLKGLCIYIEEQLTSLATYMEVGTGNIAICEMDDKDWMNKWKDFFHPFRLEDHIVIQPTWTEKADVKEGDIVIWIDPGTAFGTGSHETTRLCITTMKQYIHPEQQVEVLDAGCGSGILSIIAMKLGAKRVYGIDIDELAVEASKENLLLNGISPEQFEIVRGDVIGDKEFADSVSRIGKYDVIVSNILADVIIPLSAVMRPFLKENGVWITSGIIENKETVVKEALLENGFQIVDTLRLGEWVSIVVQ